MQKADARTFIFITEITGPNAALKDTTQDLRISGATVLLYTDCLSRFDRLKSVLKLWTTDGRRIAGDALHEGPERPGMKNLHESTVALQLDFSLGYCEKDTPAAAMARRLGRHRSCFRLQFKPLELQSRPWAADAVETQILIGCRSVFPDPVKAEGLDLHPSPATERLYSSSSGGTTAQSNPLTPGCSSADRSGPPTADTGSWSLFDRAAEQIATLLTVEADEIDLDAPVAVLWVDSLIATAFCNWLKTEAQGVTGPIRVSGGGVAAVVYPACHAFSGRVVA
ncbi:hypothetical protein BO99DRAFT_428346 [Aspergillus violaceofuscus CBS 115571]|uniref:Uncharacterized protein n=1 Tax=Aspergillus violaceofuscus (strain CBS 115571) TaxID=1450538 RepID=A0A2V5HI80_ASPV1|nr:hypothetical protein BO99DRAFT_428346 [Aspergillus violaceofuscus CBS 115571]